MELFIFSCLLSSKLVVCLFKLSSFVSNMENLSRGIVLEPTDSSLISVRASILYQFAHILEYTFNGLLNSNEKSGNEG